MYDGVETHGLPHRLRMESVFWGRQRIMLRVLDVVLAALPPPASESRADTLRRAWRELVETIYPNNSEAREERESRLKDLLDRQGAMEIDKVGDD